MPRRYYNLSTVVLPNQTVSFSENSKTVDVAGVADRLILRWDTGCIDPSTNERLVKVRVRIAGRDVSDRPLDGNDMMLTLEPEIDVRPGDLVEAEVRNDDKDNRHYVVILVGVKY